MLQVLEKKGHFAADCRSKGMHALAGDDDQEPERESPAPKDSGGQQDPTKLIGGLFLAALDDEYDSMDRDLLAMEEPRNISFTVDSCAVATVIPEDCFTDYAIEPNAQSKAGVHYRSCTGERVRDQGARRLIGRFRQQNQLGDVRGMNARIVWRTLRTWAMCWPRSGVSLTRSRLHIPRALSGGGGSSHKPVAGGRRGAGRTR